MMYITDTKKQKQENPSAPSAPPPEPCEAEGDKEEEEWNLNSADDCLSYIEHHFPHQEVEAYGITVDMFSKVCKYYIDFLRYKRTPKASLATHFHKEMVNANTLKSKAERRKWLQIWHCERKREFVAKP